MHVRVCACVCVRGRRVQCACSLHARIVAFIGLSLRLFGAGVAMEVMDACNVAMASRGEDFR